MVLLGDTLITEEQTGKEIVVAKFLRRTRCGPKKDCVVGFCFVLFDLIFLAF